MKWQDIILPILKDRNIKKQDLMPVFGVTTPGAVTHYLNNARIPSIYQLNDLSLFLGIPINDLVVGLNYRESGVSQSNAEFSQEEMSAMTYCRGMVPSLRAVWLEQGKKYFEVSADLPKQGPTIKKNESETRESRPSTIPELMAHNKRLLNDRRQTPRRKN